MHCGRRYSRSRVIASLKSLAAYFQWPVEVEGGEMDRNPTHLKCISLNLT
jgi:hypothetical protein